MHTSPTSRGTRCVASLTLRVPLGAQAPGDYQQMGRAILKELIETDTTHSTGSTTVAAERMAARLWRPASPRPTSSSCRARRRARTKGNLVARYRGKGTRKPVLFIAHLDVVEARREDWSMDPFVLTEKDGYFYGRGTLDVKGGAATLVAAFVRLRQEQWVPDRDLILALTADEEGGTDNGVAWLLANRRDLIDADYSINVDTGGGELRGGKMTALDVQASEKIYASFSLTVKNPGGHSSLPTKDNAIYRLAAGLQRLAAFEFPGPPDRHHPHLLRAHGATVRRPRARTCGPSRGKTPDPAAAARLAAKSPFHNALLRTTCVATMLQGGARGERAAADGAGDGQLPAPPDRRMPRPFSRRSCASSPIRRSSWRRSARRRRARRRRSRRSRSRAIEAAAGRCGEARRRCPSFPTWRRARPMAFFCATPAFRCTA